MMSFCTFLFQFYFVEFGLRFPLGSFIRLVLRLGLELGLSSDFRRDNDDTSEQEVMLCK